MQFTDKQISALINVIVEGDPEVPDSQLSRIEDAQDSSLTFLETPKYEQYINKIGRENV